MEGFSEAFIQREWKDTDRLVLRVVPDEEFLHKKINNRDVYVDYDSTENIPEDVLRLYGIWQHWTKVGTKILKTIKKVLESISLLLVKPGGYFWLVYFVFSLVLAMIQDLILVFPPISQLLKQLGLVRLAVLLTFF